MQNAVSQSTDEFSFALHGMTLLCLICKQTGTCFKRNSLECHLKKVAHPKFNGSYPPSSELRRKTAQLTASLCEQQNLIHRTTSTAKAFNRGIFWDSVDFGPGKNKNIPRLGNSKRLLVASAEKLFTDFDNKDAILKQIKQFTVVYFNNGGADGEHQEGHTWPIWADLHALQCLSGAV